MKKFFSTNHDMGLLFLRVAAGLAMLPFGLNKIGLFGPGGYDATVQFMSQMGVPTIITILVIAAETVGAVSLILGFCTRFCAASLALIMAGAIYFVLPMGYMAGYVTPLLFLIMFLHLTCKGGGAWSVDEMIARKMM